MSGYGPGETPGAGWRAWLVLAVFALLAAGLCWWFIEAVR